MAMVRRPSSAALGTPTDLSAEAVDALTAALNPLIADAFALYLKTKNFHWHVSGPHFRDYHLLLDEQGDQIFGMTDVLAERVRSIGGTTLRSISHVTRLRRIKDNEEDFVAPIDMLRELMEDNKTFAVNMRKLTNWPPKITMWARPADLRILSTRWKSEPGFSLRRAELSTTGMISQEGSSL
jgi:starvation-inducible DNA-binding protein